MKTLQKHDPKDLRGVTDYQAAWLALKGHLRAFHSYFHEYLVNGKDDSLAKLKRLHKDAHKVP